MKDVGAILAERYALAPSSFVEAISEDVVRVETPIGALAVKRFTDLDRAEREAAVLRHLSPAPERYRVQEVVRDMAGEPLLRTEDGAIIVTRWLNGRKKVYTEISPREWRALGIALAALHERLDGLSTSLPTLPSSGDVDAGAIEELRLRVNAREPARADEIGRYLDARLALLQAHAGPAERAPHVAVGPIHNDYNQHNYLFEDGAPPGILDWDRAVVAPREYDVVRCLNHLPLVAPENARAFLSGYREVRALDAGALGWAVHRTLVEHARKSWPVERWLAGARDADAMLRGTMEVLHALHGGAAELAAFFAKESR